MRERLIKSKNLEMQIVDPDNKRKRITFSSNDKASRKILIVAGTI